jgi:hypothetical protein
MVDRDAFRRERLLLPALEVDDVEAARVAGLAARDEDLPAVAVGGSAIVVVAERSPAANVRNLIG